MKILTMPTITYTNRKGQKYYLCSGTTKKGKTRYYFARKAGATPVVALPAGQEIRESVNGVVSLAKARPSLLLDKEIDAVKEALGARLDAGRYRVDVQPDGITVYERIGSDPGDLARHLSKRFGLFAALSIAAPVPDRSQYWAILRYSLHDPRKRIFFAERMCFRGQNHWIPIAAPKPIAKLVAMSIPKLGTDEFFEMF